MFRPPRQKVEENKAFELPAWIVQGELSVRDHALDVEDGQVRGRHGRVTHPTSPCRTASNDLPFGGHRHSCIFQDGTSLSDLDNVLGGSRNVVIPQKDRDEVSEETLKSSRQHASIVSGLTRVV